MGGQGGCSMCRLINIGLTLAMLGAGGYVLWYFLGQPSGQDIKDTFGDIDFGDFSDVLDNFTGFDVWDVDPFVGDNTTNVWTGTNGEGGLQLELWNALDDTWQGEFAEAVSDWDGCNPDALSLSTTRVEVDNACTQADGVMKVCNGNYGETGWLGINEILKTVPDSIIVSSIAKMNEYYLNNAGYDERLYTMCHEVGHGFGLPHTDENFNNKDLGNCLDYTNSPENNLRPGTYNCERLKGMYGTVGERRHLELNELSSSSSSSSSSLLRAGGTNVNREQSQNQREDSSSLVNMQDPHFAAQYDHAMHELRYEIAKSNFGFDYNDHPGPTDEGAAGNRRQQEQLGWRVLREHPRGGAFVRRLDENLSLEVHVLYPPSPSSGRDEENDLN